MTNRLLCVILGISLVYSLVPGAEMAEQHPAPSGSVPSTTSFPWPNGKRVAVSLSFDDARLSQIDTGLALLKDHHVKATFFVQPENVRQRLEGWKQAVADGHEIGNHSQTHPCTGNYAFSRHNALEDYTLTVMAAQLDEANADIESLLGTNLRLSLRLEVCR
jgi:peptidoglycan-N-acetylglucosamine deacetylase